MPSRDTELLVLVANVKAIRSAAERLDLAGYPVALNAVTAGILSLGDAVESFEAARHRLARETTQA